MEITVNFFAVLIAAIVNIAVGFAWYGPLFGKMWKRWMGFTDESMKSMKMKPAMAMMLGFITALIMAYVLGHFANIVDAKGIVGAWQLAFWVWFGFTMTTSATSFIWEGKPFKLFFLNATQQLVALFLMATVLVLFR